MAYKREDITDLTPLGLKKINDNIRNLWSKVFGDINLTDVGNDVKNQIYTNYIQILGEGNLDTNHPLYVRFYIPENTKLIKKGTVNCVVTAYRLDSDVTSTADTHASASSSTLGASSRETTYSNTEYTTPLGSGWGSYSTGTAINETIEGVETHYHNYDINHQHVIPGHSHNMQHTHDFSVTVTIDGHSHTLNKAIIEATDVPANVTLKINGTAIGNSMSGFSAQNNISMPTDKFLLGAWNILQISCTGICRATAYGIVQALQKYN